MDEFNVQLGKRKAEATALLERKLSKSSNENNSYGSNSSSSSSSSSSNATNSASNTTTGARLSVLQSKLAMSATSGSSPQSTKQSNSISPGNRRQLFTVVDFNVYYIEDFEGNRIPACITIGNTF